MPAVHRRMSDEPWLRMVSVCAGLGGGGSYHSFSKIPRYVWQALQCTLTRVLLAEINCAFRTAASTGDSMAAASDVRGVSMLSKSRRGRVKCRSFVFGVEGAMTEEP